MTQKSTSYNLGFPWTFSNHGFTWDPLGRNFRRLSSGTEISLRKFAFSRLSSHKFFDSFHVNPSQSLVCINWLRRLEYCHESTLAPLGGSDFFCVDFMATPSDSSPAPTSFGWSPHGSACLAAMTAGMYCMWIGKALGFGSPACFFKESRTWWLEGLRWGGTSCTRFRGRKTSLS